MATLISNNRTNAVCVNNGIPNFMFCWPCISIHLCNENQLDALFFLSLFHQSASTCFGHICSPSSGGTLYIYNCWPGWDGTEFHLNPANRQSTEKHNTYQLLYIYSIPPDDGLQICPKHVEVKWRNKLRINSHQVGFYYTHGILVSWTAPPPISGTCILECSPQVSPYKLCGPAAVGWS